MKPTPKETLLKAIRNLEFALATATVYQIQALEAMAKVRR